MQKNLHFECLKCPWVIPLQINAMLGSDCIVKLHIYTWYNLQYIIYIYERLAALSNEKLEFNMYTCMNYFIFSTKSEYCDYDFTNLRQEGVNKILLC